MVKAASMLDVKNYFGYTNTATFSKEWKELSEGDKLDLKSALTDGSFTY